MSEIKLPPLPQGYPPVVCAAMRNYARAAVALNAPAWLPMDTVPDEVVSRPFWCFLAWRPDDMTTGYGYRLDGKWYAAATFYRMSQTKKYEMREIEITPTHWMPLPAGPEGA